MVDIIENPSWRFRIDRYESSLYDATETSRGTAPDPIAPDGDPLICSRGGVIPWYGSNDIQARSACEAVGKRLCTPEEYARACSGAAGREFPYGSDSRDDVCNGRRNDERGERPFVEDVPELLPTGFKTECYQLEARGNPNNRIYDLSGNLAEWTLTNLFGEVYRADTSRQLSPTDWNAGTAKKSIQDSCAMNSVFDAVRPSNRVALDSFLQRHFQITPSMLTRRLPSP